MNTMEYVDVVLLGWDKVRAALGACCLFGRRGDDESPFYVGLHKKVVAENNLQSTQGNRRCKSFRLSRVNLG